VSPTTRAWLFIRGPESVRMVVDGTSLAVYGPGPRVSHSHFGEEIDATLHQAAVEQSLVLDGWTLERMTTERRAAEARRSRETDRRGGLRLVPDRDGR
jgi:hypothetical protein